MSTWKIVQESIKQSMKDLRELYEAQEQEKRELRDSLATQLQQKMVDTQAEIRQLRSELQAEKKITADLRRQLEALKGDPNRTIQDGIVPPIDMASESEDETGPIHFDEGKDDESTALRERLADAERAAEQKRLDEEAKRIMEVQKEREREYQARVQANEERRKEEDRKRKEREQEARKTKEAEKLRFQEEEEKRQLAALEASYSEISAQLSLVKKERTSGAKLNDLQKRFEENLQSAETERSSIQNEYKQAKKEMEERHARELEGFQKNQPAGSGNARIAENQKEIETLKKQRTDLESKLNGFFVRNKKSLEFERDEIDSKIDELNTMNRVLEAQSNSSESSDQDQRLQRKQDENKKELEMFDVQWSQRLSEIEGEIDKKIQTLMQQKNKDK